MKSSSQIGRLVVARWAWPSILCSLVGLVSTVTCFGLEIKRVQTCSGVVLQLRGDLKDGDFSRLKAYFRGDERVVGFDLESDGGVLEEGIQIADLARRKNLTVHVADRCNSACAHVFLAARKRFFDFDAKIGVHAVSNDRDVEDAPSKRLTKGLARLWEERGVPASAINKMVSTRAETITYLDRADLSDLGASEGYPFSNRPTNGADSRGALSKSIVCPR